MFLCILFLPIYGTLISGLLGKYTGYMVSKIISTLCISLSALLSYYYYYQIMILNKVYTLNLFNWFNIDYINVDWSFILDTTSISLLVPVCTISALVHLYAISYMSHDPFQSRFFSTLSLFTAFMIILVLGNNYLVLFVGWEMIGVASYLLISFWHTRVNAVKSGLNALLVNKVGDTTLTIALFILLSTFGSLNFSTIFSTISYINIDILNLCMIFLLIGTAAKSAQFGLHTWLLNSMEGPTPVSSLLHAACLVCAGIYLLLRSSPILDCTPLVQLIILWLGGITTLLAGIIAIVSNDMKKIIALSTMSQLGMMVVAIGLGNYNASIYHLFCHAMFKALLFMSAGSIIHSIITESQDIRTFGGYVHYLPITYICIFIASFSLMAIPGLSGYYSKDIIIEATYTTYTISGYIMYWFTLISATLTTLYSIRLIYLIFFITPNNNKYSYTHIHESSWIMLIPMIILAFLSIFIGYLTQDLYLGFGSPILNSYHIFNIEFTLPMIYKILPLILTLSSILLIFILYEFLYKFILIYNNNLLRDLYIFINTKYMFDQIINNILLDNSLFYAKSIDFDIELGVFRNNGPILFTNLLNSMYLNSKLLYNNFTILPLSITLIIPVILFIFVLYFNFNIFIDILCILSLIIVSSFIPLFIN
uniref:NADH-ubiquinone oxidoreductase chain 5 n=1 Tax=Groenewaldozyma salmanticensis TaxID=49332 RepID=E5L086_9ASCO|nr:NADH dehydrogenase subunit 5 [Groenewaldozyma salmanticensis]ADO51051.1 NADH dehydrogenase subunit 5 [Groenewaldozyma salmanticensis]